jgi:hypothetical protein
MLRDCRFSLCSKRLPRISVLLKAFQLNAMRSVGIFILIRLQELALEATRIKKASHFRERLRASGGNRTRTRVAANRIFLLLWFSPPTTGL